MAWQVARETCDHQNVTGTSREDAAAAPLVVAVVLNWNGWRDTERCLASLCAGDYPRLEVVVVDNGSTDGSVERLAPLVQEPWGRLAPLERNQGFTGGANVGLRLATERGADYVFLLNNDATVAPGCLKTLVEAAAARPDVGLVGPQIVWAGQPDRIWSAGISVDWPRARVLAHRDEAAGGWLDGRRLVQGLSAGALLVERAVLERVGLLDERYFAYYEDVDLCLRARRAGFRCLYAGDARVAHAGSASSNRGAGRSQSVFLNYYAARNGLLFMATHAPPAVRPFAVATMSARLLAALARVWAGGALFRRPRARARGHAIVMGALDAARGRFGEGYRAAGAARPSDVS